LLPSAGLALRPLSPSGKAVERLAQSFRDLPIPIIGHITGGALVLDLRCLEDEAGFLAQLGALKGR
ncbi:MAG: L-seryl-tRNA(Sec) selenium transferase, partial [Alphaproteobacteria bacterium]